MQGKLVNGDRRDRICRGLPCATNMILRVMRVSWVWLGLLIEVFVSKGKVVMGGDGSLYLIQTRQGCVPAAGQAYRFRFSELLRARTQPMSVLDRSGRLPPRSRKSEPFASAYPTDLLLSIPKI